MKFSTEYLNIIGKFLKPGEITNPFVKEIKGKANTIVEAGYGSGVFTSALGEEMPSSHIIGVDKDKKLLAKAKGPKNVEYLYGNAFALPFKDQFADATICVRLLVSLQKPKDALKEMIRITKKNGKVCAIEPDSDASFIYTPSLGGNEERYTLTGAISKWAFQRGALKSGMDPSMGSKLPSLFKDLGLKDIKVKDHLVTIYGGDKSFDLQDFLKFLRFASGGTGSSFKIKEVLSNSLLTPSECELLSKIHRMYFKKIGEALKEKSFLERVVCSLSFYIVTGKKPKLEGYD
jgi:ubiquinone/menaquinone biosynthesis C-methylase UbiE